VVDNGSTETDILEYLRNLQGINPIEVTVVRRPENGAIATALNLGLAQTRAPWICLLNNDILVTQGWLSEMISVVRSDPRLGLLNPMSNQFGLSPERRETPDAVALRCQRLRGRWMESVGCVGFCVLLPRHVLERVGTFDETFRPMYFEDADYSLRVRNAGFLCGIARGAYVYHYGGATLRHDRLRPRHFEENEVRFFKKWNRPKPMRIAWVLSPGRKVQAGEEVRERLRRLANEGHTIWVFSTRQNRSLLPDHLHVVPVLLPSFGFRLLSLWKILTKKKKFHQVRFVENGLRTGRSAHASLLKGNPWFPLIFLSF
jgi:GT2 family glycosyltransferase